MMDMMANLKIKKDQANQGKKDGTPTYSASMQGKNVQIMQPQNPLKRKSIPESQTIQTQST